MSALPKCLVSLLSLVLAAAPVTNTVGGEVSQGADSLDKRVKRLEKKTDFYKVSKMRKVTTYTDRASKADSSDVSCVEFFDSGENYSNCQYFLEISSNFPVSSLVFFKLIVDFESKRPARLQSIIGASPLNRPDIFNSIVCPYIFADLDQSRNGHFEQKIACQMIVNAQNGDGVGVELSIRADGPEGVFRLKNVVMDISLINEVITEFTE